MIVSNIGVDPGFSAIFTSNSAMHTSYVQVALKPDHRTGSYEYIARVKKAMDEELPQLTPYFGSGSLVESYFEHGAAPRPSTYRSPAPTSRAELPARPDFAANSARMPDVGGRLHPAGSGPAGAQAGYRPRACRANSGSSEKEVVSNVITALTSNQMIAPSLWIDPRNGNHYYLAVQYPRKADGEPGRTLRSIPLPRAGFAPAHAAGHGKQHSTDRRPHRGGSLSDPPRDRCLRAAARRGS